MNAWVNIVDSLVTSVKSQKAEALLNDIYHTAMFGNIKQSFVFMAI
jgi:hypothetical protein